MFVKRKLCSVPGEYLPKKLCSCPIQDCKRTAKNSVLTITYRNQYAETLTEWSLLIKIERNNRPEY